jgi:sugar-specific transcriptional regulator TrmB
MKLEEIFIRLGLPKHADAIFGLLRRKGPLSATEICRETKLHRPTVYRALSSLTDRHFVFETELGKRRSYHAANYRLIMQAFTKTCGSITKKIAEKSAADELYALKEIRFLEGKKGIRAAFDDVVTHLKRGETFYRYTSEKDLDAVNSYLSKDYRALRDRKKLERMVISNPVSGMRKRPRLERFVKFIPPQVDLFDQDIIQLVYGDRISIIDLNKERVLIIENQALAEFQKVIFRQLYDKLPLP